MTIVPMSFVRIIPGSRRHTDHATVIQIANSIKDIGLLNPITIGEDGTLIAGFHRYAAHQFLGRSEIEANIVPLTGDLARLAEIDENLLRNDLTVLQRSEHLADRKGIYERLHPETQAGAIRANGMNRSLGHNVAEIISATFTDDTAAKTGVTPRTIRQEVQIATDIPADVRKTLHDTPIADSKTDLLALARMEPQHQRRVADVLASGQANKVSEAHRIVVAEDLTAPDEFPTGKYRIIYADPPWSYGNTQPDYHPEQRDHYPVMSMADICAMPIKDIAEQDAVLFLWVTAPILEDSFQVVHAWDFKYKTCFIWDKVHHNMGHYSSVRHELLLLCTRGSCQPDVRKLFDSVQTIERTEHSVKPEQFREIIDTIYPHGRRIELFARRQTPGWEAYGNQS